MFSQNNYFEQQNKMKKQSSDSEHFFICLTDRCWPSINLIPLISYRAISVCQRELTKEGNYLFNDALNTFLFTLIRRHTYGKGPLR